MAKPNFHKRSPRQPKAGSHKAAVARTSAKVMVVVHGAGHFSMEDFKTVRKEIERRAGHAIDALPALYTDAPNSPISTSVRQNGANDPEKVAAALRTEFISDALRRALGEVSSPTLLRSIVLASPLNVDRSALDTQLRSATPADAQNIILQLESALPEAPVKKWMDQATTVTAPGGTDANYTFWEVVHYLLDKNLRSRIQAILKETLDAAKNQFEEIVVVSHSLGTVVTFEILRELANSYDKISRWFTLGCPLSKLSRAEPWFPPEFNFSPDHARFQDLGAISHRNVRLWFNLYDSGDLLADPIGSRLSRTRPLLSDENEYLIHDIFVKVGTDPISSHDYFRNGDTLDMIADVMR